MKNLGFSLIFMLTIMLASAQVGLDLTNYTFASLPTLTAEEERLYAEDDAVCLYFSRAYDYRQIGKEFEFYELFHYAFKVYKKDFLDAVNTFELPISQQQQIVFCGGKLISSGDKITILSKNDIEQKIEDEDTALLLKFPYANTGDIIEFFYVVKKNDLPTSGYWVFPASDVPMKTLHFTIICPKYLNFDFVGYNGLPIKTDTIIEDKTRYISISSKNLPKVPDFPMSFTQTYLPRVEYDLAYNYSQSAKKTNSIEGFCGKFYTILNELSKEDLKAVKKINSEIKINKKDTKIAIAKQIENYLKTAFSFYPYNMSNLSNFIFIAKHKAMNSLGGAKLLYVLLSMNNINAEFIFTSDKTLQRFDTKTNYTNLFDEFVIYLPDLDLYTSPYFNTRFGYPSQEVCENDGYIFKKATLQGVSTFYPEPCKIPVPEANQSVDKIEAKISLNTAENLINTQLVRTFSGYCAAAFQTRLAFTNTADYEARGINNFFDAYLGLGVASINVANISLQNITHEDILSKPLIMNAELKDYADLRNMDTAIFFTVGNYIGKQSEVDLSKERTLPVERRSPVIYKRTLTIDVPRGYTCQNLNDLEKTVYDTGNASTAKAGFIITAKLVDNQIIIYCEEYYKKNFYPVSESKGVLSVAAAAADFNKTVIKFIKK